MTTAQHTNSQERLQSFHVVTSASIATGTPRQRLIEITARRYAADAVQAIKHNMGMIQRGYESIDTMQAHPPAHDTRMNGAVEHVAQHIIGGAAWDYYLAASDTAYARLVGAIIRRYDELMERTMSALQCVALQAFDERQEARQVLTINSYGNIRTVALTDDTVRQWLTYYAPNARARVFYPVQDGYSSMSAANATHYRHILRHCAWVAIVVMWHEPTPPAVSEPTRSNSETAPPADTGSDDTAAGMRDYYAHQLAHADDLLAAAHQLADSERLKYARWALRYQPDSTADHLRKRRLVSFLTQNNVRWSGNPAAVAPLVGWLMHSADDSALPPIEEGNSDTLAA